MATTASNTKATASIHFLCGSDEDAVKKAAADLAQKLAPEDAMNLETIDGRANNVDEAVQSIEKVREAILTLPFFGGGKLVWWKAVNFFDETGVGPAGLGEGSARIAAGPILAKVDGTSVTLIISALGIHKGRSFSKALLKIAQAKYFDLPDLRKTSEDEIIFQIERRMKAAGLKPGPGAAERFFQATGIDTAVWTQELEKLACFAGEGKAELTETTSTASSAAAAKSSSGISARPCSAARPRPRWPNSPHCWPRTNRRSASSSSSRGRSGWRRWPAVLRENRCCA